MLNYFFAIGSLCLTSMPTLRLRVRLPRSKFIDVPECGYEWDPNEVEDDIKVNDANGTQLVAGDKVTFIKDLKVKGSSQVLKIGTKAEIRRVVEGKDHQLDCKVVGAGDMMITAQYVKKA